MAYSSSGQHDHGHGASNTGGLAQNGGSSGGGAGSGSQDSSSDNSQGGGVGGLASNGGAGGFGQPGGLSDGQGGPGNGAGNESSGPKFMPNGENGLLIQTGFVPPGGGNPFGDGVSGGEGPGGGGLAGHGPGGHPDGGQGPGAGVGLGGGGGGGGGGPGGPGGRGPGDNPTSGGPGPDGGAGPGDGACVIPAAPGCGQPQGGDPPPPGLKLDPPITQNVFTPGGPNGDGPSGDGDLDDPPFNGDGPGPKTHLSVNDSLAIPEPSAWLLMIAGFGLLGQALRTQRARRARLV